MNYYIKFATKLPFKYIKGMNYYIKFSKLPFKYALVKTSNSSNALKIARQYRSDAIVINPTDRVFTFDEAKNFSERWEQVDRMESIEEKSHYEVYQVNQDLPGLVVIEESKELLAINSNKIISWAKEKTGKDGVIWVKDSRALVFGNKKKGVVNPLLLFVKYNPKMLK